MKRGPGARSSRSRASSISIFSLFLLLLTAACQPQTVPSVPTQAALAVVPTVAPRSLPAATAVPPTWTPGPTQVPADAATARPTRQPQATDTPWPTWTPTRTPAPLPTDTPVPASATPIPASTVPAPPPTPLPATPTAAPPAAGPNLLPNGSFENGWYNHNGIPELQVPNTWTLQWDIGDNPLDPDPWNDWVRPESRVLPSVFLPPHEHAMFIWEGDHTMKVFKEYGAISFRLLTTVDLAPGTYQLEISVFPDLIDAYTDDGQKIWAPDPLSGEVQLLANGGGGGWIFVGFGRKNTYTHQFSVAAAGPVTVGAAIRGRWAIQNNGWFMDDWRLLRVGG